MADLTRITEVFERERARHARLRDRLTEEVAALSEVKDRLVELEVRGRDLLEQWGGVSVMGEPRLRPDQIAGWFESTRVRPNLPADLTIEALAQLFVDEGRAERVRGDLAFAQSIIETGSFGEFVAYNFAGIGVCDSCSGGMHFPSAQIGVRAQIQLLRNYADPESRAANLAHAPVAELYGAEPDRAAFQYDTFFLKGAAPLWNHMGGGNWATDSVYAAKVLQVYARMLAYAAEHS
jgi:hypothetical protein